MCIPLRLRKLHVARLCLTSPELYKYKWSSHSLNVFFYFHTLLQEAYSLIEKIEAEQNALYSYQKYLESSKRKISRIPPPPIVLSRTHCSVTLKPAPFASDVKVCCPLWSLPQAKQQKCFCNLMTDTFIAFGSWIILFISTDTGISILMS